MPSLPSSPLPGPGPQPQASSPRGVGCEAQVSNQACASQPTGPSHPPSTERTMRPSIQEPSLETEPHRPRPERRLPKSLPAACSWTCSCRDAPISAAAKKLGIPHWKPIDIALDSCHDILSDSFFQRLLIDLAWSGEVALLVAAPPCREYSILKLAPAGPPACRSPAHLSGLPRNLQDSLLPTAFAFSRCPCRLSAGMRLWTALVQVLGFCPANGSPPQARPPAHMAGPGPRPLHVMMRSSKHSRLRPDRGHAAPPRRESAVWVPPTGSPQTHRRPHRS